MAKLPVSVIILNHRRDKRLEACLASCRWADEVLVLDYESGFNWKPWSAKISLKRVPLNEKLAHFDLARLKGLQLAKHDWVLFLDSDEVLEPQAGTKIEHCLAQKRLAGFWLKREDIFFGQIMTGGEVGNVWLLRLVQKAKTQITRPVHEVISVTGHTKYSDILITHQAHTSLSEFWQKIVQYAAIEATSRPRYSWPRLLFELLLYPVSKFCVNFVLKGGYRDGWRGLIYAYFMSCHSLLVRIFAYEKMVA